MAVDVDGDDESEVGDDDESDVVGDDESECDGDDESEVAGDDESEVDGDDEAECDGDDDTDGDGDGNSNSDGGNTNGNDDREEGREAVIGDTVPGGIVPAGIVSTTKDFETTIAIVMVVSAATTIRRQINLRCCFLAALVFSAITRDASSHLSFPGARLINGIPSARQNANASSA